MTIGLADARMDAWPMSAGESLRMLAFVVADAASMVNEV
jgi:hypothetical protein